MALFWDSATMIGTLGADTMVGHPQGGSNHMLSGAGGNDLIIGDFDYFVGTDSDHFSAAGAYLMTGNIQVWSRAENPDVASWRAVPHSASVIEGDGTRQWYAFDLLAGQVLTTDIDHGRGTGGGALDTRIDIFAADGTTLLASGDNSLLTDGGLGSGSVLDAYLTFSAATDGRYLVRISRADGTGVAAGEAYIVNFSLPGQRGTNRSPDIGNDTLSGGDGDDVVYGIGGDDQMTGGAGRDSLLGGTGQDGIAGDSGADTLRGGAGDDNLDGGTGGDFLGGGRGLDTLNGGDGHDGLRGGVDADRFVFATALAADGDRIGDFEAGVDRVDFSGFMAGGSFIGAAMFGAGQGPQVRYDVGTGLLQGDADGDGLSDFQITFDGGPVLATGDVLF